MAEDNAEDRLRRDLCGDPARIVATKTDRAIEMTMSTMIDNPEKAGEIAGERAAQQFQRAATDGIPFEKVPAARPLPGAVIEAERMIQSDDPEIQRSGLFWKAFLTSFNATFPGFSKK